MKIFGIAGWSGKAILPMRIPVLALRTLDLAGASAESGLITARNGPAPGTRGGAAEEETSWRS